MRDSIYHLMSSVCKFFNSKKGCTKRDCRYLHCSPDRICKYQSNGEACPHKKCRYIHINRREEKKPKPKRPTEEGPHYDVVFDACSNIQDCSYGRVSEEYIKTRLHANHNYTFAHPIPILHTRSFAEDSDMYINKISTKDYISLITECIYDLSDAFFDFEWCSGSPSSLTTTDTREKIVSIISYNGWIPIDTLCSYLRNSWNNVGNFIKKLALTYTMNDDFMSHVRRYYILLMMKQWPYKLEYDD